MAVINVYTTSTEEQPGGGYLVADEPSFELPRASVCPAESGYVAGRPEHSHVQAQRRAAGAHNITTQMQIMRETSSSSHVSFFGVTLEVFKFHY